MSGFQSGSYRISTFLTTSESGGPSRLEPLIVIPEGPRSTETSTVPTGAPFRKTVNCVTSAGSGGRA